MSKSPKHKSGTAKGHKPGRTSITPHWVVLGKKSVAIKSFKEASDAFCRYRDKLEEDGAGGARETPDAIVLDAAKVPLAYISYNGRVWQGTPEMSDDVLLYDPS